MAGSFDFLHIKRHTAGSSNELSFDVLDAARSQLDASTQKGSKLAKTPGPSRGSYHGVAGTSTLSAVPEVEKRKKKRHARIVRTWVIGVLLAVVAVGAVSFAAYSFYQSKIDFEERYRSLVADLAEVDESLVKIDTLMVDPLANDNTSLQAEASSRATWIGERLDTLSKNVEASIPYAVSDEDKVALTQLNAGIEGRKKMLSSARSAIQIADAQAQELAVAASTWNKVLDADQLAREASASANNASTDETTEAAKEKTREALNGFEAAKSELENITYRHEKIDLSAQINYLDKRIEALNYAIATSDALVAGDRESAVSNNDAYNSADQEAARMALDLPLMLDEQITVVFEQEIEPHVKSYNDARDAVLEADADVRAYLTR